MTKISTTESNWWNLTLVKSNSWLTIIAITILLGFSRTEYLFKLMVLSRKYMIKYEISKYLITFYIQGCLYISTLFKIDLWPHSIELLQFSSIVSIFLFQGYQKRYMYNVFLSQLAQKWQVFKVQSVKKNNFFVIYIVK